MRLGENVDCMDYLWAAAKVEVAEGFDAFVATLLEDADGVELFAFLR